MGDIGIEEYNVLHEDGDDKIEKLLKRL